ncbi:enterobactin ABC transporter permease [Sinorhizobium fredii USDA 205]|uniref:Iron chelate uptake ABC transporter family permease subunit n=1 Tax=Rhizobium fredii TaxID=380 RepID=A0A844ABQ6_RHIFR|nr:iron chelate uptake ABC transporter family permease subunit [Sinorhizobium fredii]KSV80212.1 enterobactin ABC transporter permease [Sinorhizobium fredii USDA 205]MQW98826.1 iron chelate uptake ABC transporter family permease subunit [Sinorhizobium fredii]MQX09957.1 iron chelate uptake ABC transporter family permease subunit [Sinorhizobium fredii]UTY49225.1 iron ABC transporter permease [Sinorhizobium fredii]GEC33613.1 iron(III) ABC transporter permease [Sinorhizobium fredii]
MPDRRMIVLAAIALIAVLLFLTVGLRGNVQFVLQLRALKLLALLQVAISIAVSTVLFQTVTANRILTPSIMGLDALYLFGQTALIFALGGFGYASLDAGTKFGAEVLLMIALAGALLWPLIRTRMDMNLMLLMGVTLGLLFRSLSQLLSRLLDPNAFAIVQTASFANFNMLRADLTILGTIITLAAVVVSWRARHVLDIVGLGREAAIGLGVSWIRTAAGLLLLVAILVAVSTALVGPVVFFGLLVAALAERVMRTQRHALLLPAAALIAIIILVGGQTLLQHGLGGASTLGVVIEFVGGLVFLALLFHESRK